MEREPVHDNKTSRRRFHRVYRPRTSPIFFPLHRKGGGRAGRGGESDSRGASVFLFHLSVLYTRVRTRVRTYTCKHYVCITPRVGDTLRVNVYVCVCVWSAVSRMRVFDDAVSTYVYVARCALACVCVCECVCNHDASRDISLRAKKGSRSHRRDPHRGAQRLKDLLYYHLAAAQWTRPSAIRLFGYIFFFFLFSHKRGSARRVVHGGEEGVKKPTGGRVKPSQSIAN